ncbi:MAG: hypothetical protein IT350_19710 [Deltaproteobacteria bacterium]|nr:hypothetical protein [Deltaproteobacteria bacterium]
MTVAVSEETAAEARRLAERAGVPLSKWVEKAVEAHIRVQSDSEKSRRNRSFRRIRTRLKKGYDLGTAGCATWTREELHER